MNDDTTTTGALHPVHVGHLVMGLAFLGLVGVWAVVQAELVPTDDVRWLLPLPWVFAGAAGLLAVVLSGRRRSATPAPVASATWLATPEERSYTTVAEEPEPLDEPGPIDDTPDTIIDTTTHDDEDTEETK